MQPDEKGTKRDLMVYRIETAKSDVKSAEILLEANEYRGSNNRAYYGIYHAISAIHALDECAYKKHKDALANFNKKYVKTEIFPRTLGRRIAEAEEIRHASDYDDFYLATREEAEEQIETAKELISLVEKYVAKQEEAKMSKLYIFLADGFEEIEGLTVVDVLRRAGVDVTMVSIMGKKSIVGAHKITLEADEVFEDCDFSDGDMFVLPGGMPGTLHLGEHQYLTELLKKADQEKKGIAAICAAPSVLGDLGLLKGKKATCYPGFEERLTGASTSTDPVVTDGHITTSRGMGTAIPFALELVTRMCGKEKSEALSKSIIYNI